MVILFATHLNLILLLYNMENILDWIKNHIEDIIAIYTGLVAVASIIVHLTPSIKDDGVLLSVTKFVAKYIALNDARPHEEIRKLQE